MQDFLQQYGTIWQYVLLFFISLVPVIDISVVVPLGVILGLSPIWVMIIGFLGNLAFVLILAFFFQQIRGWRDKRRAAKGITTPSKKETRARNLWEKYGVPGLAIISPFLVGTDVAAFLAFSLGSSRKSVIGWMIVSLAFWSAILGFTFMQVPNIYDVK
nr:small multi-drug export protein [Risungbinella massiliensis]